MAQKQFKIGLSNTDKQNMAQDVYERLLALTFPEYETTESYEVGDFVVYNDQLYKCIGATSGAWDSSKWQLATLNDLVDDIEGAVAFVNDKANVNGNYPTMTVGLADNLNTKIVQNEQEVYLFRTTGGSLEVGNNCKEKGIVGGSLGFNQLVRNGDFSNSTTYWGVNNATISVANNVATVNYPSSNARLYQSLQTIKDHKYLIRADVVSNANVFVNFEFSRGWVAKSASLTANAKTRVEKLLSPTSATDDSNRFQIYPQQAVELQLSNINIIDLTAMFGATIADYIYSLETATPGAGVAWFKRYFNKPYYAYTPIGAFVNVKTSGKKVVGFNQFDEVAELGSIDSNGQPTSSTTSFRSKNFIRVLPNTQYCLHYGSANSNTVLYYYFYDANENFISNDYTYQENKIITTPSNACFLKIRTGGSAPQSTYQNDICINFHYDGERDGEYEPYESETYANDNIELIGIPHIDAQGNLYYEGNKYLPSGEIENNFGIVDLGTLTWFASATSNTFYTDDLADVVKRVSNNDIKGNIICSRYMTTTRQQISDGADKCCSVNNNGSIHIRDTAYTDAATFKTAMSGVYLVYELATPTEDSATAYPENQPCDNWGTEERIDNREVPIPVGHDTDYPLDLKSKLEILPNLPSDDGVYVCKVESGTGEYIALGAWLVANGYIKLTDISGYDAEKTQTLKNVEGTLTWVDD